MYRLIHTDDFFKNKSARTYLKPNDFDTYIDCVNEYQRKPRGEVIYYEGPQPCFTSDLTDWRAWVFNYMRHRYIDQEAVLVQRKISDTYFYIARKK